MKYYSSSKVKKSTLTDKDLEIWWKKNFSDLMIEKEFFSKNYKDGILYDYPLSLDSIEKFPPKIYIAIISGM